MVRQILYVLTLAEVPVFHVTFFVPESKEGEIFLSLKISIFLLSQHQRGLETSLL